MNQQWTDWGIGSPYYMFGNGAEQVGKQTHSGRAMEYGWNDWKNVYISNAAVKAFTYTNPANGLPYTDPPRQIHLLWHCRLRGETDILPAVRYRRKGVSV